METIWEQFELCLKSHDWYFNYSDDHSAYLRGQNNDYRIVMLFNDLSEMDEQRAIEVWNRYAPANRKREIHLF